MKFEKNKKEEKEKMNTKSWVVCLSIIAIAGLSALSNAAFGKETGVDFDQGVDLGAIKEAMGKPDSGVPPLPVDSTLIREVAAPQPAQVPQPPRVYTRSVSWSNGIFGFNAYEKLGVQAAAENAALEICKIAGNLNCRVIGSSLGFCNHWECSATATARDVQPVSGALYETVDWWVKRIKSADAFSAREKLGVEKSARDAARTACQIKGLLDCVVLESKIDACPRTAWERWTCTATATAQGRR